MIFFDLMSTSEKPEEKGECSHIITSKARLVATFILGHSNTTRLGSFNDQPLIHQLSFNEVLNLRKWAYSKEMIRDVNQQKA